MRPNHPFVLIGSLPPDAVQQMQRALLSGDLHVGLMAIQGTTGPVYGLYRSYSATGLNPSNLGLDFFGDGRSSASDIDRLLGPAGSAP